MSSGFAYIDIVLFAMLAAFIAFRLHSVLGRKTGSERRRPTLEDRAAEARRAPQPLPRDVEEAEDGGPQDDLTRLRRADPSFEPNGFLEGAKTAFGMILDAFGRGDRAALEPLVEPDVFQSFSDAIDARQAAGEAHGATLLSIEDAQIESIALDGTVARVTVRFLSRQSEGAADPAHAAADEPVVDMWTFIRDTRSRDPNWRLAETRAPQS